MEGTETGLELAGIAVKKPLHTRLIPVSEGHKMRNVHVESKERDRVAQGRGQYALTVLRERQFNENEEKNRHIKARKQARLVESQRAKFVSSLPQPAQDVSHGSVEDKMVNVYDYQYQGISRIPVKVNTVRKHPLFAAADMEVEDARIAAVEHERKKDAEVNKRAENERKAKCRFQQAIGKQKSIKSYGTLVKKLETHVQKTNRTRAFSRKMPVKDSDADGLRQNVKFENNEKVAEEAIESILQRKKASLANITLRKKVKKAARLSLGKTHAVKTSKGTLTTKQSVSGLRLNAREQTKSILQQSRVRKSNTSPTGSISSEPVNVPSTSDLKDNHAGETHPKVLTRDCATQTIMTFQGPGTDFPSSPSSISFQSLPSNHGIAPMAAQILLGKQTQSTQTAGDIVTAYKKYLLNRNKIAPSTSTSDDGKNATVPLKISKGFETTPMFSMYLKELSKKYFAKETPTDSGNGDNNAAARTSPHLFSMPSDSRAANSKQTNYFQDANGILGRSKTIPKEAKITFPVKVQRMPQSTLVPRETLVKTRVTRASEKPKAQNTAKNKASLRLSPKCNVQLDQEPKPVPLIDSTKKQLCEPTGTLVELSAPIVLTVQSPETTLVVRLAGNKDSESPSQKEELQLVDRSGAASLGEINLQLSPQQPLLSKQENLAKLDQSPSSLQATVRPPSSDVLSPQKDCSMKTSPKWQGEADFFGSLLVNCCKSERQFFRPHPPASLPLGWRQMQSPHELSTICEMDTPQQSFFDGSYSCNYALPRASKSSSRSKSKRTSSIGQVPLWEEILAKICETSTSPLVQREQCSVLDISRTESNGHSPCLVRFPSQSTPIREDNVPDLEAEAGIEDQSMISLIGSEFTPRGDEHRVPDTNRSLSLSLVGDSAMYVLSPVKQYMVAQENKHPVVSPALQSRNTTVSDSLLSFLKHEASCAFSPTPSHCTDVLNFN